MRKKTGSRIPTTRGSIHVSNNANNNCDLNVSISGNSLNLVPKKPPGPIRIEEACFNLDMGQNKKLSGRGRLQPPGLLKNNKRELCDDAAELTQHLVIT